MPRVLMLEGNCLDHQARAQAQCVRTSSQVFHDAITPYFPDLEIAVVHGAEPNRSVPGGGLAAYDGLMIGGSSLHAYDDSFAVTNQIDLVRSFGQTGKPIFGCCWGLQIAAIAAGGSVGLCPRGREVGVARKIAVNDDGATHPLYARKPKVFDALCIHQDEVTTLPPGSVPLGANGHSAVQAATFPLGQSQVWAVQYHPEFDLRHMAGLYTLYGDALIDQGFFVDQADCKRMAHQLYALAQDPTDQRLAWQTGLDADILDDRMRRAEIINWIDQNLYGH